MTITREFLQDDPVAAMRKAEGMVFSHYDKPTMTFVFHPVPTAEDLSRNVAAIRDALEEVAR